MLDTEEYYKAYLDYPFIRLYEYVTGSMRIKQMRGDAVLIKESGYTTWVDRIIGNKYTSPCWRVGFIIGKKTPCPVNLPNSVLLSGCDNETMLFVQLLKIPSTRQNARAAKRTALNTFHKLPVEYKHMIYD